jgi:hypothetical protein
MRSARYLPSEALVRSAEDPRGYRVLWLHNKLRCVLISDSRADKAAAAACVAAGHFSDPSTLPGLAHFTEHMCFLGTSKYPEEGSYKSYLTSHGGSCNASTAMETTTYHFALAHEHLDGALDRFAQFFIAPLFTPSATLRELNAVNAEHSKNLQTDARRIFQLIKRYALYYCCRDPVDYLTHSICSHTFDMLPVLRILCIRFSSSALVILVRCAMDLKRWASILGPPSLNSSIVTTLLATCRWPCWVGNHSTIWSE